MGKNEGERVKTLKTYEMFKKEYKYFQTPKCLPKCYNSSILEMKRRNKYNKFFKYTVEKLKNLWEYENNKRNEFVNKNGLYIPKSLLPQLANKAPFIQITPKNFEIESYPDKLLMENDKYINGIDSKVYYFEKVFADIVKKSQRNSSLDKKNNDILKLKNEMKNLKLQHEEEMMKILVPYKQEINKLIHSNNQIQEKFTQISNEKLSEKNDKLSKILKELENLQKEHSECPDIKTVNKKIEALKKRNTELAQQHIELKKTLNTRNKEFEELKSIENNRNIEDSENNKTELDAERINSLMKEALVNLKIKAEVPNDSTFFEHAFKAL